MDETAGIYEQHMPEPSPYHVYVQTDERSCITAVNSSAFVPKDWGTEIDQGMGGKYHHAQGNYFDQPVYTGDGLPRYKLEDGKAVERTQEEIAADRVALPKPLPTEAEWYEAVLMGDWTAVQQPRYCKDEGGTVYVAGAVACNTAPPSNDKLIHIPVGFRPKYNIPVSLVQIGNPAWVSCGWLTANGYLSLHSASQPAGFQPGAAVAFAVSFPAASY